jgi:hypothetical protein
MAAVSFAHGYDDNKVLTTTCTVSPTAIALSN